MADRGRHQMATDNECDVIANGVGHIVPDRYATDDQCKFGNAHPKKIHDPYERYGNDMPTGYAIDNQDW
jgi:hypothetical protein